MTNASFSEILEGMTGKTYDEVKIYLENRISIAKGKAESFHKEAVILSLYKNGQLSDRLEPDEVLQLKEVVSQHLDEEGIKSERKRAMENFINTYKG